MLRVALLMLVLLARLQDQMRARAPEGLMHHCWQREARALRRRSAAAAAAAILAAMQAPQLLDPQLQQTQRLLLLSPSPLQSHQLHLGRFLLPRRPSAAPSSDPLHLRLLQLLPPQSLTTGLLWTWTRTGTSLHRPRAVRAALPFSAALAAGVSTRWLFLSGRQQGHSGSCACGRGCLRWR